MPNAVDRSTADWYSGQSKPPPTGQPKPKGSSGSSGVTPFDPATSTASAKAKSYFYTFGADQQSKIAASWGGQDLMQQWYDAAVKAGAVPGQGGAPETQGATGPDVNKGVTMTPTKLRALAASQHWSEDFTRPEFTDAVLQGWINNSWDEGAQRFRSSRGATGFYDKPTECPEGQSPSGPDENSPCANTADLLARQGAGTASTDGKGSVITAPALTPESQNQQDLQNNLLTMFGNREGLFGSQAYAGTEGLSGTALPGGGIMWGPSADTSLAELLKKKFVVPPTAAASVPTTTTPATTALMDSGQQTPQITGGIVNPPVPLSVATNQTPLQQALLRKQYQFANAFNQPSGAWWAA